MNSIEKSKYINKRYKEYIRSSFKFGKNRLQGLFEKQLEQESLFKGPYVNLDLPFQRGKNLQQLIDDGTLCKSFSMLGDMNLTRPLYSHQEEAIRLIGSGHSAVITTGTGSGKTECFLFPILNDLLKDVENGNNEIGIRAIFLYPMNALVNDQIDRIRAILTACPSITYGFFTGDTPETATSKYREKLGEENKVFIPDNELVSRKEIRENPPHLLFTNYSMLEYLLIRPNDYAVFEPERLHNWKYVVLDEAHTYSGSLGIEISLLMRRLTGLAPLKPRFILTSATLGEQGESEREIVDFARSLTSSDFDVDDIIFSKRIQLNPEILEYAISGSDYQTLQNNLNNKEEIKRISEKYVPISDTEIKNILFELLSRDKNVYTLYRMLSKKSLNFQVILDNFDNSLAAEDLISLIDLINMAEKDGIGLFDLKYHSFVRPLSGAYITLDDNQKLTLLKTNEIDGIKAFEIGNCRFCNAPYIIGKIQSGEDGLQYLYQNKEVDIYENYGSNEFVKLDYFLLDNVINEEEVNEKVLEEQIVCAKCGCISAGQNLNARRCKCGDQYKKIVYRVVQTKAQEEETAYNNITQCPCCGNKNLGGVVRVLNLGKDEGTALIGQILYEAIDEGEEVQQRSQKLSLRAKKQKNNENKEMKAKQFLAFSDSRQQASFAAAFFDSNHTRMLRKRLIWQIIQDHNYSDIQVDLLAAYLTEKIKGHDLLPNDLSAHKNAWVTLLIDLLKVDGDNDGEGLGLYYFDIDLSDIMDNFSEEDIEEEFGEYDITKKDFENVIQVVFGVFKTTPAIHYVKSTLTPEEKFENLEYRRFDNYVCFQKPPKSQNGEIRSFLPVSGKENMVMRYIKKTFGCDDAKARDILDIIFNELGVASSNLEGVEKLFLKHPQKEAYQINVSKYILKNYKKNKYYRCSKCGRLTPYNVHNKCVHDKCTGELYECDPDEVLADNFYRNQYKTKKLERIVIKEHTAQLNRKMAKEFQNDFKSKKINILSCSTTFEMGIDIGNLETVFMRNVPPTPANYVQRAGRAGRRKESSAYILTYCGTGSHDFTYFNEPEKMISGIIRPPYFNVLNKKIIVRHLMATCLGFFFRNNPEYFSTIDGLVFQDGVDAFNKYVSAHPSDLNDYINNKILPGGAYNTYHDFKWFDEMGGNDQKLQHLVESILTLCQEYEEAKKKALVEEDGRSVDTYNALISSLHKKNVIQTLSQYCVIPKYGFPVDVVDLEIYTEGKKDDSYDLSRDLKIAISEYAPDSEVIVNKKKYTSKYISLPKTAPFPRHYFCTCSNCQKVNVFMTNTTSVTCKYCGESISSEISEFFIEPVNGFKTGVTKESTRMKPKRSYAGEVTYLGQGIKDDVNLKLGPYMTVETSSEDELLVLNRSKFYMCPVCGYSDIVKGRVQTPNTFKEHKNYRQYTCDCTEQELLRLGHRFKTDVARFTIPMLSSSADKGLDRALSFMYAFLEGISNGMGIERNDINGVLELNLEEQSYDMLIYDNVPGGAGHVKRLVDKASIVTVLKAALDKVSQECCDENTSCYNCLRNYYNQSHHNKLRRIYAKEYIKSLLQLENVSAEHCEGTSGTGHTGKGARKSNYIPPEDNTSTGLNTSEALAELLEIASSESERIGIEKLISYAENLQLERPRMDESIQLDVSVWPDLFWGRSKVALFLPETVTDFERLRVYDWYCFMISEDIDPEDVFRHVLREE